MSAPGYLLAALILLVPGGLLLVRRRRSSAVSAPQIDAAVSRDFLRTICHELRSPITSVAALARACRNLDRLDGPARIEALDLISRHAEQLSAILEDVREVADCVAAQQATRSTCSLREVVETAAACAGLPAERLRIELPEGTAFLATSPSALGRILTNLLQNAARYGPAGGGILVRARRCARSRTTEVAVLDEGAGPGHEAAAPPPEAQGLGSRIVEELASSLGGSVERRRTAMGYAVAVSLPDR